MLHRTKPRQEDDRESISERLMTWYARYGIALVTVVGTLVGYAQTKHVLGTVLAGVASLWLAVALFFVATGLVFALAFIAKILLFTGLSTLRLLGLRRRHLPRILAIDDQDLSPEHDTQELRGRVHVPAPLRSPLRHLPCAAFRIAGEGPLGDVDDAEMTTFEVTTDEGDRVEVQGPTGSIAIEVKSEPRLLRPDAELSDFLEERGAFPDRGPVRLAEASVRDGDEVVVQGAVETVTRPDGYRGQATVKVMRERPGAPLVLRRPAQA